MKKSGLADSPFFSQPLPAQVQDTPIYEAKAESSAPPKLPKRTQRKKKVKNTEADTSENSVKEIARLIQETGKEAATHRFTESEKRTIVNVLYSLQLQNMRTSENELIRIGLHYIIADFEKRGGSSLLVQVLKSRK